MNLDFLDNEPIRTQPKPPPENLLLKIVLAWLLIVSAVAMGNITSTAITIAVAKWQVRQEFQRMDNLKP